MASAVDLVNLALSHLGDEATVSSISPPEGSVQAMHCARYYPVARDMLLEMHDWSFATTRVELSQSGTAPSTWGYSYAKPTDYVRGIAVLHPEADSDDKGVQFDVEGDYILTDLDEATLRYVRKVTDTTKFPPLFQAALSRLLASYLAGPILKGEAGRAEARGQYQIFQVEFGKATSSDANTKKRETVHTPDAISIRGYTNPRLVAGKIVRD